jgi:type I restriction enzyme S subunit
VPQDPNDERASVLLERIAKERAQLIKEGKIKKQKPLPKIGEDETPFKLPHGWEWVRLGNVTNYGISDKVEPGDVDENTWILELEDVEKETSKLLQKVRFADRQFRSTKNRFCLGDVIYGKLRPYLDKVIVADENGVCTTEMIPIRGYKHISPRFLRFIMKSPYFIRYANESTHGMNLPRMGTDKARLALFPMVNETEQHRIVTKVDELMALCDRLEQQQTDNIETHQVLVETLLAALIQAADQRDFTATWQRIADHFDTLFTTEFSIDQLKQTILQLAVMGKLVPQDSDDEPASVLLDKIAKEKARLIEEGKIKKQKPLPEICDEEKTLGTPEGWSICRLGDFINLVSGQHLKPHEYTDTEENGLIPYLTGPAEFGEQFPNPSRFTNVRRALAIEGDILLTCKGSGVGKINLVDSKIAISRQLMSIQPILVHNKYVRLLVMSLNEILRGRIVGIAIPGISRGDVIEAIVKLPPLPEQRRIVAKVDELMALCDDLRNRLNRAQTTQVQLADAIVEQAVA